MNEDSEKVTLKFLGEQFKRVLDELADVSRGVLELSGRMEGVESRIEAVEKRGDELLVGQAALSADVKFIRERVETIAEGQSIDKPRLDIHDDEMGVIKLRLRRIERHIGLAPPSPGT